MCSQDEEPLSEVHWPVLGTGRGRIVPEPTAGPSVSRNVPRVPQTSSESGGDHEMEVPTLNQVRVLVCCVQCAQMDWEWEWE